MGPFATLQARVCLLKSLEQGVNWRELGKLIVGCKREKLRALVAEFLAGIIQGVCCT